MTSLRALAAAALAVVSLSFMAVPDADARSVVHYSGHGQFVTGVAYEEVTTITIRREIRAVRYVAYTYHGHRYTFGHGPLWAHHLEYCEHRYRSYNPHTNLFLAYSGSHHHCRSPYIQ